MGTCSGFEGRIAVVTGAAQGIGAATAAWLAARGAAVAVLDLNEELAADTVRAIHKNGGSALAVSCDVSRSANVRIAFSRVAADLGPPEILVNNAGITRDNLLFRMTEEEWDQVVDTHLKGTFLCSQEAQRYMVRQKYGKIVCISSRAALGNRGQSNYSAAKAGMLGLVRTMAIELGPFNINVNAVAPGHIDTPMTRAIAERTDTTYEEVREAAIALNAIKRVGKPDDIAAAVAFLASDDAGYITGQVLYVAGRPVS
jgi:3-oxoacyl-[acyl-carrier protein] reductase